MSLKNQITTSDFLEICEYNRLLDCLRSDGKYKYEMFARLAFCTACRAYDVLHMRWHDILDKQRITVCEQKTGKVRAIPINPSVQKKFDELYNMMGRPDKLSFVVTGKSKDKPLTIQALNLKLKEFKKKYKINVGNFSTHTFRKTFGRYVYDKSGHSAESLLLLNNILNHANIQTTKVYIGITKDEIDGVFNSIQF